MPSASATRPVVRFARYPASARSGWPAALAVGASTIAGRARITVVPAAAPRRTGHSPVRVVGPAVRGRPEHERVGTGGHG
ncbi:hypothetical protein ADL04_01215 [Streptomyces sp. NRRL B-3648]|nr:hypothetical protein ADL04_01215 [Streptomyces sp. NRRL B-3648]